jgi:hypothetical protein
MSETYFSPATDTEGSRMEIIEIADHPFFVATQFHPEYLSRPLKPSPPFLGLILASVGKINSYLNHGCRLSPRQQTDESSGESFSEYQAFFDYSYIARISDDEEELMRSLSLHKNNSQIFQNGKCSGLPFNGVNGSSGTSAESEGTTETSSNDENEK